MIDFERIRFITRKYSRVPNTSRVWNNCIGRKISPKLIAVGGGINVLGGKFTQN